MKKLNARKITFQREEPDENFPILRFVSEDGSCEMGLTPMLFGVRVRAGMVGDCGVDIDYCAGADQLFQLQLLDVIKRIIETFPSGTTMGEIAQQLPTYKRRPISEDPCWQELQAILLKKEEDEWDCSEPHEIHEEVKLTEFEVSRLRHALADATHLPVAYEILAQHELMERTPNGFVSLDPRVIETRIRRLLGTTT